METRFKPEGLSNKILPSPREPGRSCITHRQRTKISDPHGLLSARREHRNKDCWGTQLLQPRNQSPEDRFKEQSGKTS